MIAYSGVYRFDRFGQNSSDAVARRFDPEQRCQSRCYISRTASNVMGARRHTRTEKDDRHMRVVTIRRSMRRRHPLDNKEEGLGDDDQITVTLAIKPVGDAARDHRLR